MHTYMDTRDTKVKVVSEPAPLTISTVFADPEPSAVQLLLANQMNYAWEHHVVVPPPSECADVHTDAQAYAVQECWAQLRQRMSDTLVGYKSGQFTKTSTKGGAPEGGELIWGRLWRSHYFPSFDGVARLPVHTSAHPRIEGKIICHIGKTLGGEDLSASDILAAVDGIAVAIEIGDCRIANGYNSRADMIADNAGFGGFTHGSWKRRPFSQLPLSNSFDMQVNGKPVTPPNNEPPFMEMIRSIQWLATTLNRTGAVLQPGAVALSSACTRLTQVNQSDRIDVELSGLPKLSVIFE